MKMLKDKYKDDKAPRSDDITPEVLKRFENDYIVLTFAKCIFINSQKHTQLGEGGMIPIAKKVDLSFPRNHREMTFLSIATKVINRMILNQT